MHTGVYIRLGPCPHVPPTSCFSTAQGNTGPAGYIDFRQFKPRGCSFAASSSEYTIRFSLSINRQYRQSHEEPSCSSRLLKTFHFQRGEKSSKNPTPMTPGSPRVAIGDPADLGKTKAGETSHDIAVRQDPNKRDDPDRKASALRTILLLISVFLSMFLVAIDRTIISTV